MNVFKRILLIVLALAGGTGLGYLLFYVQKHYAGTSGAAPTPTPSVATTYHNTPMNVAMTLPAGWQALEEAATVNAVSASHIEFLKKGAGDGLTPAGAELYFIAGDTSQPDLLSKNAGKLLTGLTSGLTLTSHSPLAYRDDADNATVIDEVALPTGFVLLLDTTALSTDVAPVLNALKQGSGSTAAPTASPSSGLDSLLKLNTNTSS